MRSPDNKPEWEVDNDPPPKGGSTGEKEADQMSKDAKRAEATADAVHQIGIFAIRLVFVAFAATLIIRLWHVLTPESWTWLTWDQVGTIDKVLTSGMVGGVAGRFIGLLLPSKKKE